MRPKRKLHVEAGDRLRLMINPFYGQDAKRTGKLAQIHITRAYTFLHRLPVMPEDGELEYSVEWVGEGDDVVMHFNMVLRPDDEGNPTRWSYEVPLFFDCGTRCMMPGKRSTPLEEVVPELFTDADGDAIMDDADE